MQGAPRGRLHDGVALISALALLALFSILGTAYLSFMTIEQDAAHYEVRQVRANQYAEAGLAGAIGEIQAALEAGTIPQDAYTVSVPQFEQNMTASNIDVHVQLFDESSLLNANHVPREVFEALGFERSAIRGLKASLPRADGVVDPNRQWLGSIDELAKRLSIEDGAEGPDTSLFTVYTAYDIARPEAYLNLNSLGPKALTAVLNLTPEEGESLAGKRPFTNWPDLLNKSQKDPASFNIRPEEFGARTRPAAFTFRSRCYRILSTVNLKSIYSARRTLTSSVEAVVVFRDDNTYAVRFWSRTPTGRFTEASADESVEEETVIGGEPSEGSTSL